MGIFDELKRMAHPCEDEDDDFEEFEAAAPRATERRERRDRYEQPERLERAGRNESYGNMTSMETEDGASFLCEIGTEVFSVLGNEHVVAAQDDGKYYLYGKCTKDF